jgi:hypothetical protein
MPRRPLAVLTAAAALAASLAGPATADAANRCTTQAERGKVVAQSSSAVVWSTGSRDDLNLYLHACRLKDQRVFRLPGQNGGDTETLKTFRLSGRHLAWVTVNNEPAADQSQSSVSVLDLKTRKRVVNEYAGLDPESHSSTEVTALVLSARGAVAWITRGTGEVDDYSVHALAPGSQATVLDRGKDIALRSLALSADGARLYWTRGDEVKTVIAPAR